MRIVALIVVLSAACGDSSGTADAGVDSGPADAGQDAPTRDAGPVCAVSCGAAEACCLVDGEPRCIDVRADDDNCGGCGVQCGLEHGRGEVCERQRCRCGGVAIGCRGDRASWCCPAPRPDLRAYCANLERDFTDCGACGQGCDPARADRCEGGRCRCGESADTCAGTAESTCCPGPGADPASCVDLTTDRDNCGACGRRCPFGATCAEGACVSPGRDAGAEVDAGAAVDAAVVDAEPGRDAGVDSAAAGEGA